MKWFERLWVGCTLAYLLAAPLRPELFDPPPQGALGWTFALGLTAAVAAVTLVIVWLASRGRQNWARWVLLVLYAATLMLVLFQAFDYYREHPFGAVFDLAILAAEGYGLTLVFGDDAKPWFGGQAPSI